MMLTYLMTRTAAVRSSYAMSQASLTDSVSLICKKASSGMLLPNTWQMEYSSCSHLS